MTLHIRVPLKFSKESLSSFRKQQSNYLWIFNAVIINSGGCRGEGSSDKNHLATVAHVWVGIALGVDLIECGLGAGIDFELKDIDVAGGLQIGRAHV